MSYFQKRSTAEPANTESFPIRGGPQERAFLQWWQEDAGRKLCNIDQALGSYCASFPARVLPLMSEMLKR